MWYSTVGHIVHLHFGWALEDGNAVDVALRAHHIVCLDAVQGARVGLPVERAQVDPKLVLAV